MSRTSRPDPIRECPREREVLESILRGERTTDLAAHVAGCADCREIVAVSTWLQGVARESLAVGLPRAERDVLLLSYFEGLTHRQIADRLRIPVGTVHSRAARAKRLLAKALETGVRHA